MTGRHDHPLDNWLRERADTASRSACIEDNVLAGFLEGRLSDGEREAALAHLSICSDCRALVGDLGEVVEVAQPAAASPTRRRWAWVAAAAVVLAAVGAGLLLRMGETPASMDLARAVALVAGGERGLGSEIRALDLAELRRPTDDVLRGASRVLRPGPATLDRRPRFAWQAVPGASRYVVSVLAENGEIFEHAAADTALAYPDTAPALSPGATYVVEVRAEGVASEPAARSFGVAGEAARRAWEQAVQRAAAGVQEPLRALALAHVALRLGYLEEAETEARRYLRARPGDALGRATLARATGDDR